MDEGEEYRAPDKNDSSDDDLFCCPQCGEHVKYEYEPPYQEYAGGKVWGGEHTDNCPCGWEDTRKGDLANYNVRENTRNW
jgi:hypothetical protein